MVLKRHPLDLMVFNGSQPLVKRSISCEPSVRLNLKGLSGFSSKGDVIGRKLHWLQGEEATLPFNGVVASQRHR